MSDLEWIEERERLRAMREIESEGANSPLQERLRETRRLLRAARSEVAALEAQELRLMRVLEEGR